MSNKTITGTYQVPENRIATARNGMNQQYVQERKKLGELYGYLNQRPFTDAWDNPPAGRVKDASIDERGLVTFTFEVFATSTGQQLAKEVQVGRGSWSWANMEGGRADYARFNGFDLRA